MCPKTKPSCNSGHTRRGALRAGGLLLAGFAACAVGRPVAAAQSVEIRMRSLAGGARVSFDPVGLLVTRGATVRWVVEAGVHTTTAYHPDNASHPLRIPEGARPWDSGYLVQPGSAFEIELTVEGVYDYFCTPHELAGMVGRIIVGRPLGPGTLPFDYFKDDPTKAGWTTVPQAARAALPTVEDIMKKGVIPPK